MGRIEVFEDGKKVHEFSDDEIWQTTPRLAQDKAKGKKITYRQVTDDGEIIDFSDVDNLQKYFKNADMSKAALVLKVLAKVFPR